MTLLCISTSEHMLAHAFSWSKTIKNTWKWVQKYLFHHAHKRHMRGLQRNSQCWPTNFFLRFSLWALHEPLMCMMKKVLFNSFSSVFDHFWPWLKYTTWQWHQHHYHSSHHQPSITMGVMVIIIWATKWWHIFGINHQNDVWCWWLLLFDSMFIIINLKITIFIIFYNFQLYHVHIKDKMLITMMLNMTRIIMDDKWWWWHQTSMKIWWHVDQALAMIVNDAPPLWCNFWYFMLFG